MRRISTPIFKRSLILFSGLSVLSLFSNKASAQLTANYPSTNHIIVTGGTYTDLATSGSVISTANTDDAVSAATPIGFSFVFNGATYTDFILSTNGFIKMGTTAPSSTTLFYAGPQSSAVGTGGIFNSTSVLDTAIISPFNHDLIGATGAEYRVATTGTVGSRVCTIQFKNVTEKNTSILVQYSFINFQIKLYEGTNIIDFVWGTFTASANATAFRSTATGLKGSSNAANQLVSITKGSTTAWNLATFLNGNYTGNAFNYGNGTRPAPASGLVYKFIPVYPNDIAIREIYTLGKLPIAYTTPHFIRAAIKNSGTLAQTGFYVKLNITGANTFSDSVLISGINPNVDTIITFAGFTPTINGTNNVTVSVNPDDNANNNSKTVVQTANDVIYSYADPSLPAAGGVGFTGATGDFVAKFPYSGVTNSINQVGVNFFGGGVALRIGIWARNPATGLPGTLLWQSSQFTTTAGLNTIPVSPALAINDTFFAGVLQTSTTNANFAFQNEVPIRNQTFFYTSPTGGTAWTDFSASASNFRFMIEPRLQSPNDVGFSTVNYPCQILPIGQASFNPVATIENYGTLSQNAVPVTCQILNQSNTVVYTSNSATSTIAAGTSSQITFPTIYNPSVAGTYTIKVWSALVGDASNVNDTAISTLIVYSPASTNNAGTRLAFDGTDDQVQVAHSGSLPSSNSLSLSSWVNFTNFTTSRPIISKDSNATSLSYNLFVNTLGQPVFSVNTSSGLVSLISTTSIPTATWTHVAAVYDGGNMRIYINGDTAGSATQTGAIVNYLNPLYIGRSASNNIFLNGGVDEVKIWNNALTENQLRSSLHYRDSNFSSLNLVCYLRFDEGVNSFLVSDASGNCNNGTLVNMDVINGTATPAWFISNIPIGRPVVTSASINSSGVTNFTASNFAITAYNYSGIEEYYVHRFDTIPVGTSPATTPGGITAVYPRNWIVYRYGGATYDSLYGQFNLNSGTLLPTVIASDISLFRRGNGDAFGWTLHQNPASLVQVSPASVTFKFTNSAQFKSQFAIGGNNNPLPVTILSFNAMPKGGDVLVNWITASETNNKGFEVERSVDGKTFTAAGFVEGKGSASENNNYLFTDASAFMNTGVSTLYYRLKQVDFDGKETYSNMVMVSNRTGIIEGLGISPNPFTNQVAVTIQSSVSGTATIQVLDMQGRVVAQKAEMVYAGSTTVKTDNLDALANGVYFVKVILGNESVVMKLVKSDK